MEGIESEGGLGRVAGDTEHLDRTTDSQAQLRKRLARVAGKSSIGLFDEQTIEFEGPRRVLRRKRDVHQFARHKPRNLTDVPSARAFFVVECCHSPTSLRVKHNRNVTALL